VTKARLELSDGRLAELLAGRPERAERGVAENEPPPQAAGDLEPSGAPLGPVALSFRGSVIGRGAFTREGLVSEIPKARAVDLARVLDVAVPR
jgi:hypothetical protein